MNHVDQKTLRALEAVGIAPQLADRLLTFRIGIFSDASSARRGGQLIAEALGDVLGRLWRVLHVTGPLAKAFERAANTASESCRRPPCAEVSWMPPYDIVISVGCPAPPDGRECIRVGADGWEATIGVDAGVNGDPNPVGPCAVAAVTASEVFRIAFRDALGERARRLRQPYRWNVYAQDRPGPGRPKLQLNDTIFVGVGAVMHGFLWVLERWPAEVTGNAHLIDPDAYSESNAQRYAGMRRQDVGNNKVARVRERLMERQPGLLVEAFPLPANEYFAGRAALRPQLAVVGVDSVEQRRQIALKLPRRVVNMWTEGSRLGVARHGTGDGWPCLFCVYPEDESGAGDEVGQIHAATGMRPVRIRHLLDTNGLLEERDFADMAGHAPGVQRADVIGHPLRSVLGQLCAVIRIPMPESTYADVPLAFVSFMSGIMGFVETLRESCGVAERQAWQANGLKYPVPGNWSAVGPRPGCYLCDDVVVQALMRDKYPSP